MAGAWRNPSRSIRLCECSGQTEEPMSFRFATAEPAGQSKDFHPPSRRASPTASGGRSIASTVEDASSWLSSRSFKLRAMVLSSYLAGTFLLTHINLHGTVLDQSSYPAEFSMVDKLFHFGAYCGTTVLLMWCVRAGRTRRATANTEATTFGLTVLALTVLVLIYGAFDELTQPYFGRCCDIRDWFANLIGVLTAHGILWKLGWWSAGSRSQPNVSQVASPDRS